MTEPDTLTERRTLREALREPIIRAVALLDGYENPNTAPGDWWDKRTAPVCAAVLAIVDRLAAARGEPPEDHPFKDEWAFQRSMSKPYPGNSAAGQPIPPDQPCFTCGEPFSEHRAARGEPGLDVERLRVAFRDAGVPGSEFNNVWADATAEAYRLAARTTPEPDQ